MRRIVMLSGVTRRNRHDVMADVDDAVIGIGGWISNHTMFSNIATTFHLVAPAGRLEALRALLAKAGVVLDAESHAKLDAVAQDYGDAQEEISASLNLTFIHDEPDLRREVPAVPG